MSNTKSTKRLLIIFIASILVSILCFSVLSVIIKDVTHRKMIAGALASARDADGEPNLLVLDGDSGFVGASSVRLDYLNGGYISLNGKTHLESTQWKRICETHLEPGHYTLTGLSVDEKIVAIRLAVKNQQDEILESYYQFASDVNFIVVDPSLITVHIMVFPNVEVDTIARPAVYKEKRDV